MQVRFLFPPLGERSRSNCPPLPPRPPALLSCLDLMWPFVRAALVCRAVVTEYSAKGLL